MKPSMVLSTISWGLFFGLSLGMVFERISVTWFGVTFVALCFIIGVVSAVSNYKYEPKK